MKNELLPTRFQGINEDVYAGFWVRVAAKLLDFIILLPVIGLVFYIDSLSKSANINAMIPNLLFGAAFEVVLVKIYGGTPGKLIMGLKVIKKNGDNIDWQSSFYRYSVELFLAILGVYVMFLTLNLIDDSTYASLGFMKRNQLISTINPIPAKIQNWTDFAWYISGIIVLISNPRKRTTHDFIAGTVVIKSIYFNKIREIVNSTESIGSTIE
jgi:uncharacterized RDD family membrane protein YckC